MFLLSLGVSISVPSAPSPGLISRLAPLALQQNPRILSTKQHRLCYRLISQVVYCNVNESKFDLPLCTMTKIMSNRAAAIPTATPAHSPDDNPLVSVSKNVGEYIALM